MAPPAVPVRDRRHLLDRPAAALPHGFAFRAVGLADPLARPLLEGLAHEYQHGLGHPAEAVRRELAAAPAADFEAPRGCLLVVLHEGRPVAGGGYRRQTGRSAELKRIWTAPTHRRLGLGRAVVAELERRAAAAGCTSIHLSSGVRQHAAHRLYRASGYVPGAQPLPGPGSDPVLRFAKALAA
ncbi:GNAT family N-acetyltransferase [Kineococcus glutinatus]|uniref:GNAT family N-acetyltransferase n=1 Tax=Kineococcus glutinatus TaxID=1070872 RepID=A0ABP9HD10_9ACTN